MKSKRLLSIGAVLAVILLIIWGLMKNKSKLDENKQPVDRSNIAVKVSVDTVALRNYDGSFSLPATLISKEDADISTEMSGKILSLNIELGDHVNKGQLIGRLDVKETEQKLEAANLSIEKLRRDYERNKVLLEGNATNATAVTDSKYELDNKILEAEQLKTQITKSKILAPISGTITAKNKVSGEYVNTGTALATISSISTLKANLYVPESQVFNIHKGQKVNVSSELFPESNFVGTVSFISPKGDDNHNYQVELNIQNNGKISLKAGLYVNVKFPGNDDTKSLIMIPKTALVDGVKDAYVYIYKDGKSESRKITTGVEYGNLIEVKGGLSLNEIVITSGQINLIDGTKVEIVSQK